MTAYLEAKSISKQFGGVSALDDVSFAIKKGEAVALMGGNGAGKSTLVSILAGLRRPDEGQIVLKGENLSLSDPQHGRELGIEVVYQNLGLCPNLNAAGNLFLGREMYKKIGPFKVIDRSGMKREAVRALTEIGVKLPDMDIASNHFSGGQRQAIAFARAISSSCRLLILDEPTAALGVEERRNVVATVQRLRKEREITVLLITHNFEEMRAIADRSLVLRQGRVVGSFDLETSTDDEIVGSITGSSSFAA